MIDRSHRLSVVRQAQLLGLARAAVYYVPQPVPAAELVLTRRLDALHLEWPFLGSRRLRDLLAGEGYPVGRAYVRTLMRRMGISAIYRKPRTSRRRREHPVFPYGLRTMTIDRPNQVSVTAMLGGFKNHLAMWRSA